VEELDPAQTNRFTIAECTKVDQAKWGIKNGDKFLRFGGGDDASVELCLELRVAQKGQAVETVIVYISNSQQ